MDRISKYLNSIIGMASGQQKSYYENILAKGKFFKSVKPDKEQLSFLERHFRRGDYKIKQCFLNSQESIIWGSPNSEYQMRLEYYEGWVDSALFPIEHAWVVLDKEIVVDLTLRVRDGGKNILAPGGSKRKFLKNRVVGEFPENWEYFGLTFHADDIQAKVVDTKMWSPMMSYGPVVDKLIGA